MTIVDEIEQSLRKKLQNTKPGQIVVLSDDEFSYYVRNPILAEQYRQSETIRASILQEGINATMGDRNRSYGEPRLNLGCAGELKRVIRNFRGPRYMSPAEEEAIDNALTKIARIITGPSVTRDNYVDGATYLAIAGEAAIQETLQRRDGAIKSTMAERSLAKEPGTTFQGRT